MRRAPAGDVRVLDRVEVERAAVGVLRTSGAVPSTKRQLNAEVLSASIERKSLPPYASTGTIRLIGKPAS